HSAVLVHSEGVATVPAFPAPLDRVVDPTGAGDTFAGGMMAHIAKSDRTDFETLQSALAWGTVMASHTIEAFGLDGIRAIDDGDLNTRLEEFRRAARIA
ncbi:MAG: PfkB family carbohydrate kinase, partial [Phycisphaerales bacterium]